LRFLIDECLPPELTELAQRRGHEAAFVPWVGKAGMKDWELAQMSIAHAWILVTNNSRDFRGEGARPGYTTRELIHPGLVCLNCDPAHRDRRMLAQLFQLALDEIEDAEDLINTVVEITQVGDEATVSRYLAPPLV
jgi:predicted nuclease of predicted toxin-antitoxin system